jgi:hypothetical protein
MIDVYAILRGVPKLRNTNFSSIPPQFRAYQNQDTILFSIFLAYIYVNEEICDDECVAVKNFAERA